jgi:pimeloyl-ACP methyl ester carboxylesterase
MDGVPEISEHLDVVDGVPVRSLRTGDAVTGPHVVVLPGLGALGYVLRFARAVAEVGGACSLLDLPGFGTPGGLASRPTVEGIGATAAQWVRVSDAAQPVVLLGHSTGAQAALHAGVALQDDRPPSVVVMAGPTVAPSQRSLPRLAAAVPAAYSHDSMGELVVLSDFLRASADLMAMLRSAIADRPEVNVAALRPRLLLTAGRRDAFAPPSWLSAIATAAVAADSARVVQLPGSHNNPYTHASLLARLVVAADRR